MTLMLPAEPAAALRLTGVLPALLSSVRGDSHTLPPSRSAIAVVVDGLGAHNLDARAGHARFLTAMKAKKDVARSVFPTTTATALTSLLTATDAGAHGIVGYRVRVPETGILSNQLTGWEGDGLDPLIWQRRPTFFERNPDVPAFVVSREEYRGSGFTRGSFRGATFLAGESVADRLQIAAQAAHEHPGALVYAYAPELDSIGHRRGWESDDWIAELEEIDQAVRRFHGDLPTDVGAVLTADHGMVDVPRHAHVLLDEGSPLLRGVAAVAGEPRMLHLYADLGATGTVLDTWRQAEGERSWVLSREEAIEAGLFGPSVAAEVEPRIGDVLVAARARVAYYDDRPKDKAGQKMIGQHGSLTSAERIVPLIRLGAFAR